MLGSVSVVPVCTLPNDNVIRRPALSTAWVAGQLVRLSVSYFSICCHRHVINAAEPQNVSSILTCGVWTLIWPAVKVLHV